MTVVNHQQAIDETFALINTAWTGARAIAAVSYNPEMRWEGMEVPTKPGSGKYWARSSMEFDHEQQATLSNCVTAQGKRRFKIEAILYIQVFAPKNVEGARDKGQAIAELLNGALRGKSTIPGAVVFYNASVKTLKPDNEFHRWNVQVDVEFEEFG